MTPTASPQMSERVHAQAVRAYLAALPEVKQPFPLSLGVREHIAPEAGEGHQDLISLSEDIFVVVRDFRVRQDMVTRYSGEDLLKVHWQTAGHGVSHFSNRAEVELRGATLAYLTQPLDIEEEKRIVGGAREASVTVCVTRALLRKKLDAADVPAPVRAFLDGARPAFACQSVPLPPALRSTLHELLRPPPIGGFYHLYLEARICELLWLSMRHLNSLERTLPSRIKLSARDRDRINEIRLLLERTPESSLTMLDLCRRFGINRNKINYGFQLMFANSPANYAHMARLSLARRMLCETDRPIAAIATELGYQQQSTFSSAYKRRFGVSPRDVRRGARLDL